MAEINVIPVVPGVTDVSVLRTWMDNRSPGITEDQAQQILAAVTDDGWVSFSERVSVNILLGKLTVERNKANANALAEDRGVPSGPKQQLELAKWLQKEMEAAHLQLLAEHLDLQPPETPDP